jgi:hypothetical protein
MLKTISEDRPFGFVLSEASGRRSREQMVLDVTAVALPSGTALGKLTANGRYVPYLPGAATGAQNFAGILGSRREIDAATQRAVAMVRDCEVNGRELVFINALDAGQLAAFEAAAAAAGVLVRY